MLETTTIYPTEPQNDVENSAKVLLNLIKKYDVNMFAIGNGTASVSYTHLNCNNNSTCNLFKSP